MNLRNLYRKKWFPYLFISLLIVAVYGQTIFFDFSSHDDVELLVEKAVFLKNPANIVKAFTTDVVWGHQNIYYRPALTLSFMVDTLIGGTKPLIFHLGNILIHIFSCCLLFILLDMLKIGRAAALTAAAIFSIHPVLIQAVAWIPGRNDPLLTFFILISLVSYLKFWGQSSLKWFWLHLVSFFAALMTKETAVFLPALLLLYSSLLRDEKNNFSLKKMFLPMIGWMVSGAVYLFLRMSALSGATVPFDARMNTFKESTIGFLSYIGKIFLPINLSGDPIPADLPVIYGIFGLILLVAATVWLGIKNKRIFLFGLLWFLLFLIPTFLGNTTYANFAEHRLYLPLIGLAIMLLHLEPARLKRIPVSVIRGTMVLVIVCFAGINLAYSRTFKNGLSHWKRTAEVSPHSYVAHTLLGRSYATAGKIDLAEKEFITAFKINPRHYTAYNDLCLLYLQKGEYQKAEKLALDLLKREPGNAGMHNTLGLVYLNAGRPDLAETEFQKAVELGEKAEAADNLGYLCLKKGDWTNAEKYLTLAHRMTPNDSKNLYHLSFLYYSLGAREKALEYYEMAVKNGLPEDPRVVEMLKGQ